MLAERNTKGRESLASNLIVPVAFAGFSYVLGKTFSGQMLWVILSFNFLLATIWQSLSSTTVSGNANAKLENWQDKLTDRFAFQEILSRLDEPGPRDFDAIWNRALERAISDIRSHELSRVFDQPLSTAGGYTKLFLTALSIVAFLFLISVAPALLALYWI
jgi:hypothetical protein